MAGSSFLSAVPDLTGADFLADDRRAFGERCELHLRNHSGQWLQAAVRTERRLFRRQVLDDAANALGDDIGCLEHLRADVEHTDLNALVFRAVREELDAGQIAVSDNDWGVRTTDARLVGSLTEFKPADTLLNRVTHYAQYGCYTGNLTGPIYGGWCMGSEGVAVTLVAYSLSGLCIHGAIYNQHFPFHLHWGSNTTRELLWPISVAGQAMARNSKLLHTSNGFSNAGPMTEMVLYETACHALVSTVSGWHLWEMASTRNKYRNRATPMEARLGMEVGHAAANMGMTREQANEIVKQILPQYEDQLAEAPIGKRLDECYNLETVEPTQEYVALYEGVKEKLSKFGLDYSLL